MRFHRLLYCFVSACILIVACTPIRRERELPIFLYQELQDSIMEYVKTTPPIEDLWGLPTITQVIFDYHDGDTIVIVRPALSPYSNWRDSVIGANMLQGRICEVIYGVYGSFKHLPGIVNEELLTIPQEKYDQTINLPPEKKYDESNFRYLLNKGRRDKVYVINRPEPLKLIAMDGITISK